MRLLDGKNPLFYSPTTTVLHNDPPLWVSHAGDVLNGPIDTDMKTRMGMHRHRPGDLFMVYDTGFVRDIHAAIRTLLEALVKRLGKQEEALGGAGQPPPPPRKTKGDGGQGQQALAIAVIGMDRGSLELAGRLVEALRLGCMLARELTVRGGALPKLTWSTFVNACKGVQGIWDL